MVSNDPNEKPSDSSPEENDLHPGMSDEQYSNSGYNELETWKRSRNLLFSLLGIIALGVAFFSYLNRTALKESSERSYRFVDADSEDQFLSFADDYDDNLGGVAQFRAAAIQYREGRYEDAAINFLDAGNRLNGDPLQGRARIGHAVSLIRSGKEKEGGEALQAITQDSFLLPVDRFEASYLLGVKALNDDDYDAYELLKSSLGDDESSAEYLARLVEYKQLLDLYDQAISLPELNLEKGAKYLSLQRKRKSVKETASGLLYESLRDGNGSAPGLSDEVEVHYHGTLVNGEVFDSSVDRGEPAKFMVGQVISGWSEALQLMHVGDKWKLFIPSALAYGERGNNSIGPNEALTFEVELLGITPPIEVPDALEGNATIPPPVVFPDDSLLQQSAGESNSSAIVEEVNASE